MSADKRKNKVNPNQNNPAKRSRKSRLTFVDFINKYSYILIIILAGATYAQTIGFGLTNFDDNGMIQSNYPILSKISNAGRAFTDDAFLSDKGGTFYRPLQTLTFMLDAAISGKSMTGYHLSNLFLHVLCALAFLYLLKRLKLNNTLVTCAAMIFAVHPLFAHAVSWLPSRGDLLSALFCMLSFIYFIRYYENNKIGDLIIQFVTYFLALLSKESTIVLPIIFLIYAYSKSENILKDRKVYASLPLWIVAAIAWYLLRNIAIKIVDPDQNIHITNLVANLAALPEFLFKTIIPFSLAPMPAYSAIPTLGGIILLIALIVLSIKVIINSKNKSWQIPLIGFVWFIIFTLPAMMYRPEFARFAYDYLEHRAYLPSVGIFIILIYLLESRIHAVKPVSMLGIATLITILFIIISVNHSKLYANPSLFLDAAIEGNPGSAMAYNSRGLLKSNSGKTKEALDDYDQALILNPQYFDVMINRGVTRGKVGDVKGAMSDLDNAIALKPNFAGVYNNRGTIKKDLGDLNGAIEDFNKAISLDPSLAGAYLNRAVAKGNLGDKQAAVEDCNIAIGINPNYSDAFFQRGCLKREMTDTNSALSDFTTAITANPFNADAYNNRGIIKGMRNDYAGAAADFDQAISSKPDLVDAYNNRGNARYMLKDKNGAIADWQIAARNGSRSAAQMLMVYGK